MKVEINDQCVIQCLLGEVAKKEALRGEIYPSYLTFILKFLSHE